MRAKQEERPPAAYPPGYRRTGLAAIRGNEWVAGIAQGLNLVKVSVDAGHADRSMKWHMEERRQFIRFLGLLNLIRDAKAQERATPLVFTCYSPEREAGG